MLLISTSHIDKLSDILHFLFCLCLTICMDQVLLISRVIDYPLDDHHRIELFDMTLERSDQNSKILEWSDGHTSESKRQFSHRHQYLMQSHIVCRCIFFEFGDSRSTYFTMRDIDNSLEWDDIFWIEDIFEISKDVFDFFSFKKFISSLDLVGDCFGDKYLFKRLRLCIGTIQYCVIWSRSSFFVFERFDEADDIDGFFCIIAMSD